MSTKAYRDNTETVSEHALNRRNVLLGGTTLAAATALSSASPVQVAQAQQPAAPPGQRPNILVIWGDDIGTWNISHNNRGMMGYMTPNIDRIAREGVVVHRLLRSAILHRGPRRLHRRQRACAHRHDQGRPARRQGGLAEDRRHDGHRPEEPRLCDRPVRQEPPGRPRRAPADACTASTSSSATSTTSMPRRSRRTETIPKDPGRLPKEVWAARRSPVQGRRRTAARPSRTPAR